MSTFEVKVQPLFVKPHPNADRLSLANVGSPDGWQVVIGKVATEVDGETVYINRYNTGDLVAYIGENAVVPEWVLKRYGYWNTEKDTGLLAGSKGNRVKAVRLRDEFSLGICIPVEAGKEGWYKFPHSDPDQLTSYFTLDEDVSEILEITKYEPPIPVSMAGEVYSAGSHVGVKYDIENIKKFPDVFQEGEEIQATEKIHGTFCQICVMPVTPENHHDDHFLIRNIDTGYQAYVAITSKGMGNDGLFLKNNEKNANNIYVRTARKYFAALTQVEVLEQFTICGEVFGNGVQDLTYGYKQGETDFRLFDVYLGRRGIGAWLDDDALELFVNQYEVPRVPVLYRGPFKKEVIEQFAQNTKSVFDANQVREGVVIKPVVERHHPSIGRVVLKSINEKYLTRKNATEFN